MTLRGLSSSWTKKMHKNFFKKYAYLLSIPNKTSSGNIGSLPKTTIYGIHLVAVLILVLRAKTTEGKYRFQLF